MRQRLYLIAWAAGVPARVFLIGAIHVYRATLGLLLGGRCRFYPSCSSYAEQAIRQCGAARGLALSIWRVLRCSPLSKGGVDHPPAPKDRGGARRGPGPGQYEAIIHPTSHVTAAGEATR